MVRIDPNAICSYVDCGKPVEARGFCVAHYTRWIRYGNPDVVRRGPEFPVPESKKCKICEEVKPLAEFTVGVKASKGGKGSYCLPCHAANQREWRERNPERVKASTERNRDNTNKLKRARRAHRRETDPEYVERERLQSRESYHRNADRVNLARKLKKFGLTEERFQSLLDEQGGGCAICGSELPNGRGTLLFVDHDRRCCPKPGSCGKCVRGLLCHHCNTAIGLMSEDADRMRAAITYIDRYAVKT